MHYCRLKHAKCKQLTLEPPSQVWVCKDPDKGPIMSKKDLHIVSVPDLPPKRASRVLALKEAPPIPARCEYGLYLAADNANEADLSRKVVCVHNAYDRMRAKVLRENVLTEACNMHYYRWKSEC